FSLSFSFSAFALSFSFLFLLSRSLPVSVARSSPFFFNLPIKSLKSALSTSSKGKKSFASFYKRLVCFVVVFVVVAVEASHPLFPTTTASARQHCLAAIVTHAFSSERCIRRKLLPPSDHERCAEISFSKLLPAKPATRVISWTLRIFLRIRPSSFIECPRLSRLRTNIALANAANGFPYFAQQT
ncbi:hypothetical protein DFJ73DRAFT_645134, partial [Zopfochytrium polystomum]